MRYLATFILTFQFIIGVGQSLETVIQKGHELAVISVATSVDSNFVATGSRDKSIKLWELSTGREVRSFLGHEMSVTALRFSPDGKILLSGSNDKTVRGWEVTTGKEIFKMNIGNFITDLSIAHNGKFFAVAGYNQSGYQDSVFIYEFKDQKKITGIPVDPEEGRGRGVSVSISPDDKLIAFGEDNRIVSVYNT
jgi:WD40 repeat protein